MMVRMHFKLLIIALLGVVSMGWVRVAPFRSRLAHSKKLFGASQQTDTDSIPPVDFTNESSSENTDHINVDAPEEESLQALEEEIIDFSNTSMPVDPKQQAIMQKETVLRAQLLELEERLRRNRLELGRVKDRVSESGKNGFFLVQAQVNEFLRKKETELKYKVEKNKKDFVERMVPIVQMFRAAPVELLAETEREQSMHKNFGSLLDSIVNVIDKYGYRDLIEVKSVAEVTNNLDALAQGTEHEHESSTASTT